MKRVLKTVLAMALALSFILAMPIQSRAASTVSGKFLYGPAFECLTIVNAERAKMGLSPLSMDADLLNAAMLRAAEITFLFEHTRPNGTSCTTILPSKMSGENIAYGMISGPSYEVDASMIPAGTPSDVMVQWMNSSGHRANILESSYKSIGIGCFRVGNAIYWTQTFGRGNAVAAGASSAEETVTVSVAMAAGETTAKIGVTPSVTPQNPTVTKPVESAKAGPVYRLYLPSKSKHHYTMDENEKNYLMRTGWNYEGIAWNGSDDAAKPVYRLYLPSKTKHHYTTDENEKNYLMRTGWNYEGIAWNSGASTGKPVYRVYLPSKSKHHYTTDENEKNYLVRTGWNYEGIAWYSN